MPPKPLDGAVPEFDESLVWRYGVPVQKLWYLRSGGVAVVLRGFIDESYDGSALPKVFNLSCVVADSDTWPVFERQWAAVLDWKNQQLRANGRKEISRFHSGDISNFAKEFAGWYGDERTEFTSKLVNVFSSHGFHVHGYDLPLQLLVDEIPVVASNPLGFAYVFLFQKLMLEICDGTLRLYPKAFITLHHDRCRYDAALQKAFGHMIADSNFKCRSQFLSVTAEGWEQCIPLQAADFLAYENYKESLHQFEPRERRKSLSALLDVGSVSGRAQGLTIDGVREMKQIMDNMDEETKDILMRNMGIVPPDKKSRGNNQT